MASARDEVPKAPPVIERCVRQLIVASKAVALYPPASKIPLETSETAAQMLRDVLRDYAEIRIVIDKNGLYFADAPVSPDQQAATTFALDLYGHHLSSVTFRPGVQADDVIAFFTVLNHGPEVEDQVTDEIANDNAHPLRSPFVNSKQPTKTNNDNPSYAEHN